MYRHCFNLLVVLITSCLFTTGVLAAESDDDLIKQLTDPKPKKPAKPTGELTDAQKQAKLRVEIQSLFIAFQKPYEENRRTEIADSLLKHGPDVARRLIRQVSRDFQSKYQTYLEGMQKAASKTAKSKQTGAVIAQVESLRKTVLALSRNGEPSKAQIVQTGDPAMKKLEELLSVSSDALLSDERYKLGERRRELLELVAIWGKAHAIGGSKTKAASSRLKSAITPPDAVEFEKELTRLEKFSAQLGTPMSSTDQQTLAANFRLQSKIDPAEFDGVLKLNMMRIRLGIGALSIDVKLSQAARDHSKDMQEHKFFSHTSPLPGKARFTDRAKLAGSSANSENIFMGRADADSAIMAWWHSPGHHVNMVGKHKRIGLGRHGKHWTQMFGR